MKANDSFNPHVLLRNRHVQSIINSLPLRRPLVARRARKMLCASKPHIIDAGEGIRLQGYYAAHPEKQTKGLCILIHGWEGSADSLYLVSAAGLLFENGYDVFRLNLRDHGKTHHLNRELFHSCRIHEVVAAIRTIQDTFFHTRLLLGGFSLGGNFALRVAVRAPDAGIHAEKVAAVCPVLRPLSTLDAMENGFFLYEGYFMKKWRRSLRLKEGFFPDLVKMDEVNRHTSIRALTDYFIREYTDFANLDAYLSGYAITGEALKALQIPAFIISSLDDPVIPSEDLKNLYASDCLHIEPVPFGGHCGFIENFAFRSWAERRILELFEEGSAS